MCVHAGVTAGRSQCVISDCHLHSWCVLCNLIWISSCTTSTFQKQSIFRDINHSHWEGSTYRLFKFSEVFGIWSWILSGMLRAFLIFNQCLKNSGCSLLQSCSGSSFINLSYDTELHPAVSAVHSGPSADSVLKQSPWSSFSFLLLIPCVFQPSCWGISWIYAEPCFKILLTITEHLLFQWLVLCTSIYSMADLCVLCVFSEIIVANVSLNTMFFRTFFRVRSCEFYEAGCRQSAIISISHQLQKNVLCVYVCVCSCTCTTAIEVKTTNTDSHGNSHIM